MISLKELMLKAYPDFAEAAGLPDIAIRGLECDSRKVEKDFLFIAIQGINKDGTVFIREALERGAAAVVADKAQALSNGVPLIRVPEGRLAAARLASVFYGEPSAGMKLVGITGTNGKTTSSYLIEYLLNAENKNTGVLGTVSYRFAGREIPAVETTPGPLRIHQILSQMRQSACRYAVMEVSSHALDQRRVEGIAFEVALFTNLTQDHLDYHGDLENYFECKARLFLGLGPDKTAVLNADDARVSGLKTRLGCRVLTYSAIREADFRAENIRWQDGATRFDLLYKRKSLPVELPLIGLHNVYNTLGALAVAHALGCDLGFCVKRLAGFEGVPGRLEAVRSGQDFLVFIDFAHTPDGLENVLSALVPYKQGKLTALFGCGGDRDRTKRPMMAAIAARFCDFVYVTSDNPRSENAKDIAAEICAGFGDFKNYTVVLDRKKAVRQALLAARRGDIVLLAGKGHERAQIVGAEALPYHEREEAERVLHGR